ncbi:MAG TPA: 23S rRNA (adenine(2503)-C(2))-methyltransferase RlmN [Acidimicrobiia bacterium]|nr:23S rRNA (adenine(2503)-C(2))-methyltransferase RlmN [Acidimicrobiia bacterium]
MPYLIAPEQLAELLPGEPSFRAGQLQHWLYRTPVATTDEMSNLPGPIRAQLRDRLWPFRVEVERSTDGGRTRKWLFRAHDGAAIEAVLMNYPHRATLCISSQAGCALACTFCATGQFGFERHLEPGEIMAQVAYAQAWLRAADLPGTSDHLTNVVFMGMGEPLANYRRVREGLRRLIEVMGMSARSITVSTVGVVPGMRRLAEEPWPVNLAVSLHAADDSLRSRLVPLNRRYPLAEVEAAAAHYFERKHRRISIEWTMIDGVNDSLDQAAKLAAIARRLRAHVNLIPLNPTPLSLDRPTGPVRIASFAQSLTAQGVNVTVRETRGQDIEAACGQLRAARGD